MITNPNFHTVEDKGSKGSKTTQKRSNVINNFKLKNHNPEALKKEKIKKISQLLQNQQKLIE